MKEDLLFDVIRVVPTFEEGELTCAEDLPFIKFLHFVGEMIVGDRDKEKLQAMKKAKEGGGPRAAFARSDVW